ncbi:hypothetical protein [Brevundimonas sp.]|uniref:hypothetical protein n=1 Tax=Brevundimonas sp. TaxID=1871086 RepID=UPI0035628E61
MTLHAIVAALGGDLYQSGLRANVPAPGHSPADRSVSLLLSQGRVIIHGFGAADWGHPRPPAPLGFYRRYRASHGGGAPPGVGPGAGPPAAHRDRLASVA